VLLAARQRLHQRVSGLIAGLVPASDQHHHQRRRAEVGMQSLFDRKICSSSSVAVIVIGCFVVGPLTDAVDGP
jgi:hypothetical protein